MLSMNSRDSVEMLLRAVTYVSTYIMRKESCTLLHIRSPTLHQWNLYYYTEKVPEMDVGLPYKLLTQLTLTKWPMCQNLSSPRAKRPGPKGLRAESARAVTGRRNSHRWEGGRLFEPSAGFFYGNSCNFGTESRKIVSKVGN